MTTTLTQDLALADAQGRRVGWRGWAALAVLMLPVLLVSVDNTVLSFALPAISLDLAPTSIQQLWIIDAYPLVLASLLVTMGSLGDRFGRRRMLLIGATGFAAVSVLAAFAPTAALLIAARAGMGVFGAMLMPSTLSLLRGIFTDRDQRRLAIAVWAAGFSAGSALGPIVGGLLLEHFAWGSVFLLSVPVLVPLLVLAPLLVPESRDPNPGRDRPDQHPAVARHHGADRLRDQGSRRPRSHRADRRGDRDRDRLRHPLRPPSAARRAAHARHAPVPPRHVLRRAAGEPAQRRRARRIPLLRRPAPAADRRPQPDGSRAGARSPASSR